jgi:hypothetical protein
MYELQRKPGCMLMGGFNALLIQKNLTIDISASGQAGCRHISMNLQASDVHWQAGDDAFCRSLNSSSTETEVLLS